MSPEASFEVTMRGSIPVIAITGDLDHFNSPKFRELVTRSIENGATNLVVDMTTLDFMDSGGMSALIFAMKRLKARNGHLYRASANSTVSRKLEIGGLAQLSDFITITPDVNAAVISAQTRPED
jgi:anti-sigma B factor antagonist